MTTVRVIMTNLRRIVTPLQFPSAPTIFQLIAFPLRSKTLLFLFTLASPVDPGCGDPVFGEKAQITLQ